MLTTIHKPTAEALTKIRELKNELAGLMFKYYLSLDTIDKQYVDIMLNDSDIRDDVI